MKVKRGIMYILLGLNIKEREVSPSPLIKRFPSGWHAAWTYLHEDFLSVAVMALTGKYPYASWLKIVLSIG